MPAGSPVPDAAGISPDRAGIQSLRGNRAVPGLPLLLE